jgi:hypothetical protein
MGGHRLVRSRSAFTILSIMLSSAVGFTTRLARADRFIRIHSTERTLPYYGKILVDRMLLLRRESSPRPLQQRSGRGYERYRKRRWTSEDALLTAYGLRVAGPEPPHIKPIPMLNTWLPSSELSSILLNLSQNHS